MTLSLAGLANASQPKEKEKPKTWPNWKNQMAVVFACGPSLSEEQIKTVHAAATHGARKIRTIAVCDAGLTTRLPIAAPWADILYAADRAWWALHDPIEFDGLKVGPDVDTRCAEFVDLTITVGGGQNQSWSDKFGTIAHGGHSGYQAINLAGMLGANTIVLLGYDCKKAGGKKHFYGDHPDGLKRDSPYPQWVQNYQRMAATIKHLENPPTIYNCTPDSAIQAFQKRDLREIL